jgi:hypothetical protein
MRSFSFFILLLVLSASAPATEPADLASDLGYLRVRSVVRDHDAIAAALAKPRALVLDLRQPADERGAGETLRQLLDAPAGQPRLYVLVSPATPVPVVGAIAANPARMITLGIKGARPGPQVVIEQAAEADRAAYAALESGTPLAQLISGKIEKERFDEAALVKEFKNGNHDAQPPAPPTATGTPVTPAIPPTDRVLQRTLHLHRALQALKAR